MNRFGLALIALCFCGATYAMEDAELEFVAKSDGSSFRKSSRSQRSEGSVFLTNEKSEEVGVEWEVCLTKHMKGSSAYEKVPEFANNYNSTQKVNWMVNEQEAESYPVYYIRVGVYRDNGSRQLIADKSFERTLSPAQLFGDPARNNLYIEIDRDNNVDLYIGK